MARLGGLDEAALAVAIVGSVRSSGRQRSGSSGGDKAAGERQISEKEGDYSGGGRGDVRWPMWEGGEEEGFKSPPTYGGDVGKRR